jgi:WD40 repeat protein
MHDFASIDRGGQLAVAGSNGIELWDLDKRARLATWAEDEGPWVVAAVSPGRNVLVAGNDRGTLVAWQLDTQTEFARWESADSVCWDRIVFAPDGHTFATAGWDRLEEARIFDLNAPEQRWCVPARQSKCVAFHPDGQRLAAAWMDDGRLYDWKTQEVLHTFRGHSDTLSDLVFSSDGQTLATVGHDRKLRLWNVATGKERYALVAHRNWVRSVAFSPDGWALVTSGDDRVVRIWHLETGQLLMELPDEGHGILKVRFTPDGRNIVCCTADGRIVVYDSKPRR